MLGLDLQGGFEVVLKAEPPPGRPLQDSDIERSTEIIRNRVDKLGVAEPEIRRQGDDQIAVALPGVDDPDRVRDVIGSTAKLELYDLETSLTGPSINANGEADPERVALRPPAQRPDAVARRARRRQELVRLRRRTEKLVAGPLPTKKAIENAEKVKGGEGVKTLRGAERHARSSPAARAAVLCPPGVIQPSKDVYYLFKYRPNAPRPDSADDGRGPAPERDAPGLRHAGRNQPIVTMQFTDAGERQVPADHARGAHARPASATRRSTSRSCSTRDPVVAADRLHRLDPSDGIGGGRRADRGQLHRSRRPRTSRSCSRPVRCRSSSRRSPRRRSPRRSARTRSARRSARPSRAWSPSRSSCSSSTASSASSRSSASPSTRRCCTR